MVKHIVQVQTVRVVVFKSQKNPVCALKNEVRSMNNPTADGDLCDQWMVI
jgi:hypothetical protein